MVDDELQEDLSIDLPTVIAPGTGEPTVITPELAPPVVFPTQGDILRAAAFVTVQLLWNVSGIAQAMDDSSVSCTVMVQGSSKSPIRPVQLHLLRFLII